MEELTLEEAREIYKKSDALKSLMLSKFSKEELELLVYCYDYKEVYGEPNIFIHGNHNTGVLYVVENIKS